MYYDRGDARDAAGVAESFTTQCGTHAGLHTIAYRSYMQLSEWGNAATQATKLIEGDSFDSDYWGWRAKAWVQKGEPERAADDYRQALLLRPNLIDVPIVLADIYERQGRHCDAVFPLEQLLHRYPNTPGIERIQARINRLLERSECKEFNSRGGARIPLRAGQKTILVRVRISDTLSGRFVVDTGASHVALSSQFAERLGLTGGSPITVTTANGPVEARLGILDKVAIQRAVAHRVPATIHDGLPDGLDGLLGLSFLSRFDMVQSESLLELRPRGKLPK